MRDSVQRKVNWILDADMSRLLRYGEPRATTTSSGQSRWRSAGDPPDPQMAEAGVMEDGVVTPGTGERLGGAVISPLLNICLHYV